MQAAIYIQISVCIRACVFNLKARPAVARPRAYDILICFIVESGEELHEREIEEILMTLHSDDDIFNGFSDMFA